MTKYRSEPIVIMENKTVKEQFIDQTCIRYVWECWMLCFHVSNSTWRLVKLRSRWNPWEEIYDQPF